MKPKEYLLSIGAIKEIGRGRLSREHIEMCKEAAKKGVSIEGYSVTTGPDAEKTVEKVAVSTEKQVIEPMPIRYPEDEYVAVEFREGKRVLRGMREACRQTGLSLVGCPCDNHQIVAHDGRGNVSVTIERKN
jgi:hypothetical protein